MPSITQQKVRPTANPNAINGDSLLNQAVKVEDLGQQYTKMVLYGANRVGKTTLACEFPKPLLIVSFEPAQSGGAISVKKVPGVRLLRLESKEQALTLARELSVDTVYKTVVVDTATSLQDIILKELMGLEEVPVQMSWGSVPDGLYQARSEQAKEVLRKYVNLPKDVIICAKEKDHNPPKGDRTPKMVRGLQLESFISADLGSATAGWLFDACDYFFRLYLAKETRVDRTTVSIAGKDQVQEREVETGKIVRRLLSAYHPNFAAGVRSCNPASVPDFIEAVSPREMYQKIDKIIRGG